MTTEPLSAVMLRALRNLIANDSYAMSFQSMGQYRTALLSHFDNLVDVPDADIAAWAARGASPRPQETAITLNGGQQTAIR